MLDPLFRHETILDAIEKKKAQLADLYSYRPLPDPLKGKGHLPWVIQRLEKEIAGLEEEERKLSLQARSKLLPGATIYGVRPDSNEYVAWDGEQYVLRPSRDNVLADDSLMPIGSVRKLRVDHPHPGPMGQVEVVIPTLQEHKAGPPQKVASRRHRKKELIFSASHDYRSIRYKGAPYSLTRNQSTIIRLLYEAHIKGTPALGKSALLSAIEAETSRVRDSFKGSPLWGALIVANRSPRGTYQLNLK